MFSLPKALRLCVLLVAGLVAVTSAMASHSAFTTIDAPGAGTGNFQGTIVVGIDAAGDVAGTYRDSNGVQHGYVLPAGGTITTFSVTGAGTGAWLGTNVVGINSSGVIAGTYSDNSQANHGFVRAVNGTITTFDAPGAPTSTRTRGTVVTSINDSGVIVGYYVTGISGSPSQTHGFMRAVDGTIMNIDDPDAVTTGISASNGTLATAINASGVIAGSYRDASRIAHGFVLSAGTFTNFDPPGVGTCTSNGVGGTSVQSIDPAGDVSGNYYDTNCAQHGYLRTANGTITPFTISSAATSLCPTSGPGTLICDSQATGIGPAGDITGGYVDSNDIVHGFLRAVDTGNITSFDEPNAGTGPDQGTEGFRINAAGTIAGVYVDSNGVLHGFLYTPALTATTTTLSPAPTPNPSVYGEPVTLSATVSSSSGTPPNGENVSFMSGATLLGAEALSGGAASLTTTALAVGTDSITAVYGGDSDFSGSTSAAVNQVVGKAGTNVTLSSSANPCGSGQSVTFTANVSGQYGGVVTGTVTFSIGNTSVGSAAVSANSASLTITGLSVGTDTITAVYNGDSNFSGSTSNALSQVVVASPSVSLSGTPTTGLSYGQTVTLTATVSPQEPPQDFYTWSILDGTNPLVSGAHPNSINSGFVYTTPGLSAGLHTFTAVYSSPNPGSYPGDSLPLFVNVNPLATLISPTPGLSTVLGTSNVQFQWSSGSGVSNYQLCLSAIGPGGCDLFSFKGPATSVNVYSLPANGVTVYATLSSYISGAWQNNQYLYTESGTAVPAVLTSPTPGLGTVVGASNVHFQWSSGTGVTLYQFCLSATAPGGCDLFLYKNTGTTVIVPSLPANGITLYARLYSYIDKAWQYNDYVYTESGTPLAVLQSPSPGLTTVLGTSNVAFQWSAGTGVTDYQLNLSAIAPGDSELFLYKGSATTATVPSLPANGVTVYARLYSLRNGVWQSNDYVYTESGTTAPAILTFPSPGVGTVLGTSDVLFQWTAGTGATLYQLNLSAIAPGGEDLYVYKGTATSTSAPTLPANGVKVYARLYSYINKAWQFSDYVYTEQ